MKKIIFVCIGFCFATFTQAQITVKDFDASYSEIKNAFESELRKPTTKSTIINKSSWELVDYIWQSHRTQLIQELTILDLLYNDFKNCGDSIDVNRHLQALSLLGFRDDLTLDELKDVYTKHYQNIFKGKEHRHAADAAEESEEIPVEIFEKYAENLREIKK